MFKGNTGGNSTIFAGDFCLLLQGKQTAAGKKFRKFKGADRGSFCTWKYFPQLTLRKRKTLSWMNKKNEKSLKSSI